MANRSRFPFKEIVDAKFALKDLDAAFKKAAERTVRLVEGLAARRGATSLPACC